jgi:hypothetical protein
LMMFVVLAMSSVSSLHAQLPAPPPGGPPPFQRGILGRGVDPLPMPLQVLIDIAAVRDELKLTDEQIKRLVISSEELSRHRQLLRQVRRDRLRKPDETDALLAAVKSQIADAEAAKLNILDARQRHRLDQIQFQIEGPMAFGNPDFRAQLDLDKAQSLKVGAIVARGFAVMQETSAVPFGWKPGDAPLTRERIEAILETREFKAETEKCRVATLKARAETMNEIEAALSDTQRASYRRMLGEPFDLAKLRDPALEPKQGAKLQESK